MTTEQYSMNTVEQTFSITPEQQAAKVAPLPPPPPPKPSVVSQPAFWAIALAGLLWYSNSK